MLASWAPDLHAHLAQTEADGLRYLTLSDTLIPTDPLTECGENGKYLWFSGKHMGFGVNVQVIIDPSD